MQGYCDFCARLLWFRAQIILQYLNSLGINSNLSVQLPRLLKKMIQVLVLRQAENRNSSNYSRRIWVSLKLWGTRNCWGPTALDSHTLFPSSESGTLRSTLLQAPPLVKLLRYCNYNLSKDTYYSFFFFQYLHSNVLPQQNICCQWACHYYSHYSSSQGTMLNWQLHREQARRYKDHQKDH